MRDRNNLTHVQGVVGSTHLALASDSTCTRPTMASKDSSRGECASCSRAATSGMVPTSAAAAPPSDAVAAPRGDSSSARCIAVDTAVARPRRPPGAIAEAAAPRELRGVETSTTAAPRYADCTSRTMSSTSMAADKSSDATNFSSADRKTPSTCEQQQTTHPTPQVSCIMHHASRIMHHAS